MAFLLDCIGYLFNTVGIAVTLYASGISQAKRFMVASPEWSCRKHTLSPSDGHLPAVAVPVPVADPVDRPPSQILNIGVIAFDTLQGYWKGSLSLVASGL